MRHQSKPAARTGDSTLVPLFPGSWRRIGRYELIAEIARGGMGAVYLCRQTGQAGFQRLYALKLMHQHLAENSEFVGMFLDEARIAASIHHHNVVGILDLGRCERGFYVVMEYIEGCTLSQLLRRSRQTRPPQLVAPIILGLLDGLHAAHTHQGDDGAPMQLVHRDVSPANVLIGVDGVARITDFGVAKARSRITCTQPGVFKGKLAYTAPELLDQSAPIDARADVFAAGAVLWRALTGRNLFLGDGDAATIHNILRREIPRPSTVGLRPPPLFDDICLRALAREPSERYQSAADMARELRAVCAQHQLLGAPSDVSAWIRSTFRDDLSELRTAIRLASEQSTGADRVLPELPAIKANGTGSHSAWTPSALLTIDSSEPVNELDELEIEFIDEPAPSRRRTLLPVGLALAALLAATVAVMLSLRGGEETTVAPAQPAMLPEVSAPAPVPTAEPVADPLPTPVPVAKPEPAPTPPSAEPPTETVREERAKPERRRSPRKRADTARQPRPAPAPAPEPAPAPDPEPEIEHNPYLAR